MTGTSLDPLRASATELAAAIRAGKTTSRAVVDAHIAVLERTKSLNAIAADRFDAAREDADLADKIVSEADDPASLPPLHGVPCTIKEMIALEGMPHTAGLTARRGKRAAENAPAVQRLLDAGAIPLGVTNTAGGPWYWTESNNWLYGRSHNAYDPSRTAGGSSSGEGIAVGTGGSPIGLGSDLGGSIRIPALFNGVFGHKPSPGLVPSYGHYPNLVGESGRMFALGPLARRAEDLMPFVRIVAGPDPRDPLSREAVLGDPGSVSLRGLPVLLPDDSSVSGIGAEMLAARQRAAEALSAAGAQVQEVSMKPLRRALSSFVATAVEQVDVGELFGQQRVNLRLLKRVPLLAVPTVLFASLDSRPVRSVRSAATRRLVDRGRALAEQVEAAIGDGVLLHPSFSTVAPRHRSTLGKPWKLAPTAAFNLLGLPVTQVPLGLNEQGLPTGVQVAAGLDRDHVSIRVAMELERALGGWVPPTHV